MTKYLLVLLVACTSLKNPDTKTLSPWVGKPAQKLDNHDYFSKLFLETKIKTDLVVRDYIQRRNYSTKAGCEALGSCAGMGHPVDCHNIFEIQKEIIVAATREGNCLNEDGLLPE